MQPRPWRRWLIRGAVYFGAWTLVALFFFTREASRRAYWNEPLDWGNLLLTWLVGEYIWAIVALAVLALGWRWPVEQPGLVRRIALHLVASLAFAAMQLGLEAAAYLQLGTLPPWLAQSFAHAWPALLVLGFHGNVILYWVILGVQTGYRHYTRLRDRERLAMRLELDAARLRSQLVEAQLGALKAQLQPHFLFNTLNAITVLVRERETARAELMLARLADFLRRVLDDGTAQEVELRKEVEIAKLYLAIEQARFADRLSVSIDADPATLDAVVPHLLLQPILENAVKHGVARSSAAGTIRVRASREGTTLVVRVQDDGPGFVAPRSSAPGGSGIGLANTQARLARLYGDAASLTIEPSPAGAAVAVKLPFRRELDGVQRPDR